MTVKELIVKLQAVKDPDSPVLIVYQGPGGCDTCGFGSNCEDTIDGVDDLEGKVWLEHS